MYFLNIYGRPFLKFLFDNIRHLFCFDCATCFNTVGIRANCIKRFLTSCSVKLAWLQGRESLVFFNFSMMAH